MAQLTEYQDFEATTGPVFFTDESQIVNESQRRTYILKRLLSGDFSERVQGGSKIVDRIILEGNSSYKAYDLDDSHTWDDPQVIDSWEVPFRNTMNHYKVTGAELEHNEGGGGGMKARFQQYKKLRKAKESNCFVETVNGMEDETLATPSFSDMEAAAGKQPYSLAALISEHAAATLDFGTAAHSQTASNLPGADPVWAALGSTLQGIDFTGHNRRWHNHKEIYNAVGLETDADSGDVHLFAAFSRMYRKTKYNSLPQYPGYAERPHQPGAIFTSDAGQANYETALRINQDHFRVGAQDPAYDMPMYRRVDVINIEGLGTQPLYTDLSTGVFVAEDALSTLNSSSPDTSAADGIGFNGPRYYFVDGRWLKKTFKAGKYFAPHEVIKPTDKVETLVYPFLNRHNNHVRSRMRMGIVSPFENVA
jgi:hypothetical protein